MSAATVVQVVPGLIEAEVGEAQRPPPGVLFSFPMSFPPAAVCSPRQTDP